jgi:hypothetical protein
MERVGKHRGVEFMTAKKRRHPKLSERYPITVLTQEGEANGETRSLTVEGVFFHCLERLKEGEVCHVKIDFPENPVELAGRLTWSNADSFKPERDIPGMGFCFVKVSDEYRELLGDVIDVHSAKKRLPPGNRG